MIEWTIANPYLTTLIILLTVHLPFNLVSRLFRVVNITLRGWPTNQIMDADGDIVYKKEKPTT